MKVAVCNLQSGDFESKLIKSIVDTGFVVVTHHGIDHGLIKEAQHAWREFFLSPSYHKTMYVNGNDTNMGYKGVGGERAVGAKVADVKEFFHWKPGYEIPANVHTLTATMFQLLEDVGSQILTVIDKNDGTNYERDCDQSDNTLFRTLYYPALNKEKSGLLDAGAVRAAAHEDINHVTLLVAASAPGLQVMDVKGNWHDVPHEENSITVNIGDMLQLASDGRYKSTTHRVVNPPDDISDRISMPLFIHPHPYTPLAPGVTAASFLKQRLSEIYGTK